MRVAIITLLLVLTYNSGIAQADANKVSKSRKEVADSIDVFYKALFKTLKGGYLDRKKIDWMSLQ